MNINLKIIFKLIEKIILSRAVVLVAFRPAAVANYRDNSKQVEVLGFFKEQVSDYIDSYKFGYKYNGFELKRYLECHPNVHHVCYTIQLAMICFLIDQIGNAIPRTETDIYQEFAKHMLLRTLYRYKDTSEMYLKSYQSLKKSFSFIFACLPLKKVYFQSKF